MTHLGIRLNKVKCMQEPQQQVTYLGHHINLKTGCLTPIPEKNRKIISSAKHQLAGQKFVPKHLAALAGQLIDAVKSNSSLQGMPQQIMQQAARVVGCTAGGLEHGTDTSAGTPALGRNHRCRTSCNNARWLWRTLIEDLQSYKSRKICAQVPCHGAILGPKMGEHFQQGCDTGKTNRR